MNPLLPSQVMDVHPPGLPMKRTPLILKRKAHQTIVNNVVKGSSQNQFEIVLQDKTKLTIPNQAVTPHTILQDKTNQYILLRPISDPHSKPILQEKTNHTFDNSECSEGQTVSFSPTYSTTVDKVSEGILQTAGTDECITPHEQLVLNEKTGLLHSNRDGLQAPRISRLSLGSLQRNKPDQRVKEFRIISENVKQLKKASEGSTSYEPKECSTIVTSELKEIEEDFNSEFVPSYSPTSKDSLASQTTELVESDGNVQLSDSREDSRQILETPVEECDDDFDSDFAPPPRCRSKKSKPCQIEGPPPTSVTCDEKVSQLSDLNTILQRMLPVEYDHVNVCIEPYAKEGMFKATFRANIRSKEEALQWLTFFKASSFLDFSVDKCFKENSDRVIFKKRYKCYCNTGADRNSSKTKVAHSKNTGCQSLIQLTVKNFNMKWSEDKFLKSHPCEIMLHHRHNHPIQSSHALRHRKPSKEVEQKFMALFERGHSPSSALREHRFDLQNDHKPDFIVFDGDGAHRPNLQWAYYLYYKTFKSSYGDANGEGMIQSLEKRVAEYNVECGSVCAKICTENSDIIVAICWPMMKRIHSSLNASGEIAFVDIGGGIDRHNTRVLLMMTPSVAGALPLGILLMSCESQNIITKGLDLLHSLFPQDAFHGRGVKGPKIFLTDDSASERNSLQSVYEEAILLLCTFHILQAFWRYLVDSKHGVLNWADKGYIFDKFHSLLYSPSEEEFESTLNDIVNDEVFKKYKKIIDHLVNDMIPRAREWALCYRSLLVTRGNNTNNFVESAFRVLKDIVMQRCRAYSVVQLFHFMITNFPAYIERRLSAIIINRLDSYWQSRFFIPLAKLEPLTCSLLNGTCYVVSNSVSKGEYIVDTKSWLCSCYIGKNGASCKHQYAVAKQFNLSSDQFLPVADENVKRVLYYIMTGSVENLPLEWFKTLSSGAGELTLPQESYGNGDVPESCCTNAEADSIDAGLSMPGNLEQPDFSEKVADCSDHLDMFVSKMKELLSEKPDVFVPAVEKFWRGFSRINGASLNSLSSALHCCFKDAHIGNRKLLRGREILANRESVGRRASHLGGRRVLQSGRPSSNAAKRLLNAARKRKAPHNLPQVVRMKCAKLP